MDPSCFPQLANIMRNNMEMQRCMLKQNRLLTELYIKNNELVANVLQRVECMNKRPPTPQHIAANRLTEQNPSPVDSTLHNLLRNNINNPDRMSLRTDNRDDDDDDDHDDDHHDDHDDHHDDHDDDHDDDDHDDDDDDRDDDDNHGDRDGDDDDDTVESVPSALTNEDRAIIAEQRASLYQDKTADHRAFERRLEPFKLLMLEEKIKNRKKRYRIRKYFEQHCECFVCHGLMWEPATKNMLRMHLNQRPKSWPKKNFELRRSTAEHKQPKHCGGTEKYDNLVVTCLRCNQKRGDHFSLNFPDSSVASSSYTL